MAYVILFIFGCLLMLAGGAALIREALKYKRMAAEYEESAAFWYDRWYGEVQDNVDLYNDLKLVRQLHSKLAEEFIDYRRESEENLKALETGTQEIEENYQQELLTEYDKVADLQKLAKVLDRIVSFHEHTCLPHVYPEISMTRNDLNDLREKLTGERAKDEQAEEDPPLYRTTVIQSAGG